MAKSITVGKRENEKKRDSLNEKKNKRTSPPPAENVKKGRDKSG